MSLNPTSTHLVSAVFDNHAEAERAVSDLRAAGVTDASVSIVAQHGGHHTTTDGAGTTSDGDGDGGTREFVGKTAAGAGIGTLLGIAALAIPGVGPLAAAGAIAATAVPAAAVTGAALGGAAGGLAKVLTDHGVEGDDARYYEDRVSSGGVFVSVDTSTGVISSADAADILHRAGGHSSRRARGSVM